MGKKTHRLLTSQLDLECLVGENTSQEMISRTITLPTEDAPVFFSVSPRLKAVTAEVLAGKVLVEGQIEKSIKYAGSGEIREQELEPESFSSFVDLPGAEPGMKVSAHPRIESVEHHVLDTSEGESRVLQKTVLEILVKVTNPLKEEVATGIEGIDQALVSSTDFSLTRAIGEGWQTIPLEKEVQLEFEPRHLEADFTLSEVEALPYEGGVSFTADLGLTLGYSGAEGETAYTVPPEEIYADIAIPGTGPQAQVDVYPRVMLSGVTVDPENRDKVVVTLETDVFVRVTETVEMEIITEVEGLLLARETVAAGITTGKTTVTATIGEEHLLEGEPDNAIVGSVHLRDLECEISGEQVLISGVLEKELLYTLRGEEDFSPSRLPVAQEFSEAVAVPGLEYDDKVFVYVRVEDIQLEIGADTISDETKMQINVSSLRPVEIEVVVADEIADIPEEAALIIYVVRQGDTVFKISRRFGIPMEDIIAVNDLEDPDMIYPGDKFIIPVNQVK